MKVMMVSLLSVFILLAAACQKQNGPAPDENLVTAASVTSLHNVEWQLQKMIVNKQEFDLVADSEVSLQFTEEGKVAGKSSVNQYFGAVSIDDKGALQWPEPGFGSTMMAGPPELMNQERTYLDALRATDRAYLNDSSLTFQNTDQSYLLEFRRK